MSSPQSSAQTTTQLDTVVRLVKLIKDLEGMVNIAKNYTGKLEQPFAVAASKRLVAIDQELYLFFSEVANSECLEFMSVKFTSAVKGLIQSVKSAMIGDFTEIDMMLGDMKSAVAELIQKMKKTNVTVPVEEEKNPFVVSKEIKTRTRKGSSDMSVKLKQSSSPHKTQSVARIRPRSVNLSENIIVNPISTDQGKIKWQCPKCGLLNDAMECKKCSPKKKVIGIKEKWECQNCKSLQTDLYCCTSCGSVKMTDKGKWRCSACTAWTPNSSTICSTCGEKKKLMHKQFNSVIVSQ